MDRKETGNNSNNSNQHPNSDLESEVTTKVKMANEKPYASSSAAVNKSDSVAEVTGEDQNGKNPALIQGDSKSSISNEIKDQEEEGEMDSENILFNLTEEEKALAQQIFLNHLTLRKILDNSSVSKLFDFRLVNKLWAEEATSVIKKASVDQLYLQSVSKQQGYHVLVDDGPYVSKGSLSELNSCISSSRRFPCSNFSIWYSENFEQEDMTEFLRLHGEEIKTIIFVDGGFSSTSYVSTLRKLLLEQAPNIQSLKIVIKFLNRDGELLFPENVILPHLKYLHFNWYCSQIGEIIRASPNLQEIRGDAFKHVHALVSMGKINIVKDLHIISTESGSLDLLQKWAEAKPKLTSLALRTPIFNMGNPLSKILEASRESLKEMDLNLREEFFDGVLWPKFENVQSLSVQNVRNVYPFPQNFISAVFPNITKLNIFAIEPMVTRFLTNDSQLRCLKTLKMNGGIELLELLVRAAPNVQELNVTVIPDFLATVSSIWGFSKLKKFTLSSSLQHQVLGNKFPQLDMAITGLSEEVVRKLHEDPVYFEEMKMKGQEIPRVNPSILDCQVLETVTLDFRHYGISRSKNPTLFTSVSGEFGFKLISRMDVELICKAGRECDFSPLAPYVKIIVKS